MVTDATTASSDLPYLRKLVEENKLKPNIAEVLPLSKVREAWASSQTMHAGGKIVLNIAKESSA
jgi:D-arabinose 1-dehydrogenase-like Zn-dependent alcohol dehydrogenase